MINKKMSITKIILSIGVLVFCASYFFKYSPHSNTTLTTHYDIAEKPLVLRFAGGNTGIPSPFGGLAKGAGRQTEMLFDSLIEHDEKGSIPWLARNWSISKDGLTYHFYLQPNVTWHDGMPFTGDDVLFTFEYYQAHAPLHNELVVDNHFIITGHKLIDPLTIQVKVDLPSVTYLEKIGSIHIIPKHIWKNVTDPQQLSAYQASIGTGPFVLQDYRAQQGAYRLTKNQNFWGPSSTVDALEWVPVGNEVLAFENGNIDLISVTPDLLPRYQNDPQYRIVTAKGNHGCRLLFNMRSNPLLSESNIRNAFSYGINRQELVEKIARGSGEVGSDAILPKHHPFFNPQAKQHQYDPEKARELLNGQEFTFDIVARNNMDEVKVAKLIKASLDPIGLHLKIRSMDGKSRNEVLQTKRYDIALFKSVFGGDPDYLRTSFGQAKNANVLGGFYDPRIHKLGQKQLYELNPIKRKALIFEMQDLIAKKLPQIILYTINENYLYRPKKFNGWRFRHDRNRRTSDLYKISFLEMNR